MRGILALLLAVLLIAAALVVVSGKLEAWFGITIFGGPRLLNKIVFVSDRSGTADIYVMDPDGSDQKPLTTGAGVMSAPFVSATGRRVVFVAMIEGTTQVFCVGGGGGEPEVLSSATGSKLQPEFTPNGKRLSFISSGAVYVADPNGEGLDKVLPTAAQTRVSMMKLGELPAFSRYAWNPDSTRVAAAMRGESDSDILVYLAKPGEAQEFPVSGVEDTMTYLKDASPGVPEPRARINGLAWSPDGNSLAVAVAAGKNNFLALYDFESKQVGLLAAAPKQELADPCFSPDGLKVVYIVAALEGKAPGAVLDTDVQTGQARILAKGDFANPAYSPDGTRILATSASSSGDKRNVVTIDAETGEVTKLTRDGHSFDAVWSPTEKK